MNILFTILIVRAMIDAVGTHMVKTRQNFWAVNVLIVMIAVPTMMGVEYGTLGLALALFGYFARRRAEGDPAVTRDMVMRQMGFALFIFCFYQYLIFQPTQVQFVVMAAGVAGVSLLLSFFRPAVFARTGEGALPLLTAPLRFMGRHTLGIYVAHLLLFKALGMWLDPERFPPFTWVWIVF